MLKSKQPQTHTYGTDILKIEPVNRISIREPILSFCIKT